MRELYAYVWRSSASQQIILIILAIIAAVLATAPLELQRHIINTLAGHEKFERLGWLCGGYLIVALAIGGPEIYREYQKRRSRRVHDPLPACHISTLRFADHGWTPRRMCEDAPQRSAAFVGSRECTAGHATPRRCIARKPMTGPVRT